LPVLATLKDGRIIAKASVFGPDSYDPAEGVSIPVEDLRAVEDVIVVSCDGNYLLNEGQATISDNIVTVFPKYFQYSETSDGPAIDVPSGDLSAVTFTVIAIGF